MYVLSIYTHILLNWISEERKKRFTKCDSEAYNENCTFQCYRLHFLKKILISDYYCYTKYPLLEMFVQSNWVFLDHCYYFVRLWIKIIPFPIKIKSWQIISNLNFDIWSGQKSRRLHQFNLKGPNHLHTSVKLM